MKAFVPNKFFENEIADQDDYREGLRAIAGEIKQHADPAAEAVGAPWMPRGGHETIEVGEDDDGVYVANTDHAGHLMEYGSVNNPPHAILRTSARAAGLDVTEDG